MKVTVTNIDTQSGGGIELYTLKIAALNEEVVDKSDKLIRQLLAFPDLSINALSPTVQDHLYTLLIGAMEARRA